MSDATLILGAGGFIGRHLVAALCRSRRSVIALGRDLEDSSFENLRQQRGSIEDTRLVRELLEASSAVVYLACSTTPGSSAREPELEVLGNLMPLARFLEIAQDGRPRRLLFVSSAGAVYGECADGVNEAAPVRPRSYYGAGKLAAEALLHAFCCTSGWSTAIVRPTNVYGPGQLPIKGFAIVPTIFRSMLEQRPFEIWGDGSIARDFLFIADFAELLERVLAGMPSGFSVCNAASGNVVSINELIRLCEHAAGSEVRKVFLARRGVDIARVAPAASLAWTTYGWRSSTTLASGLEQTWQWLSGSNGHGTATREHIESRS
jgi:UDP-glucose 4-epimerase